MEKFMAGDKVRLAGGRAKGETATVINSKAGGVYVQPPLATYATWNEDSLELVERPAGDSALPSVEVFISRRQAEINACALDCGAFGQCKANMHGVPSECASRGSAPTAVSFDEVWAQFCREWPNTYNKEEVRVGWNAAAASIRHGHSIAHSAHPSYPSCVLETADVPQQARSVPVAPSCTVPTPTPEDKHG